MGERQEGQNEKGDVKMNTEVGEERCCPAAFEDGGRGHRNEGGPRRWKRRGNSSPLELPERMQPGGLSTRNWAGGNCVLPDKMQ